jgi:hypothetical protein
MIMPDTQKGKLNWLPFFCVIIGDAKENIFRSRSSTKDYSKEMVAEIDRKLLLQRFNRSCSYEKNV